MISNNKTPSIIYLPLLFCSSAAIAAGQSASSQKLEDEYREVNNANYEYVGGKTRIGVGVDTEFDGTADISHIFSETKNTATSGDAWIGFDVSGNDKGVNAGGARLNHHWVSRDAQGRPLRVNKIFGAYDQNTYNDDKVTVGYGQEIDKGFWEGYVGKGLSGKRVVGTTNDGRTISEKGYEYNVGGQVGTFLPGSDIRVRGGLDYAWDDERGLGEDKPRQYTVSAGVEKFFRGTPHSVSLDVATSRNEGGHGSNDTDTRGNLSYRYDFGGADIYQSDKEYKRVRVEIPGHAHPAKTVRKAVKVPYKQAYKKAVKVRACQLVKSTVELGSDTFFKPNSSRLIPSAKKRLNAVVAQIRRTGYQGNIRITGNTCDIGTLKHNQVLSEKRAKAVKKYFAKHGFSNADLVARGLGETKPKYQNTKGNRHKNRRVDIEYVTQDGSCKDGYKTIQQTAYKTAYKTEYKNVTVKQAGISKPSVTWKTEVVQAEPAWVKRGLHNSIRHNRHISTYQTTAGSPPIITPTLPVLTNDAAVTTEDIPVTIDVLANDTGNGLTITSVTQPANGVVTIVNGAIVFTPNQGFTGTDSFTYTVTDENGAQAQATVNVTVNAATAINVAPIANDDTRNINIGQTITVAVLANDSDPDGDTLSLVSITQPANGTATITNDQIIYTAAAGFVGTDSLTYTISDGNNNTATATLTIVVTDPNGNENVAPIAQDDTATSNGAAVTIDVLNNDTDADNDTLTITNITQGNNGTVVINNGQIVFTPNQGFTGTDTFTYTISDGNGNTATATVSVIVTGSGNGNGNVAPIAQDDNATSNGGAVTIDVINNDSDADNDTLTITNVTQGNNGTVIINNGQVIFTPNQGFAGTDTFTYTITDGNGNTATATVSVIVTGSGNGNGNVAPIAQDDTATSNGAAVTIDVINNDTDADGDTLTITNITQGNNGTVVINNGQIVFTPNQGFAGTDTFTYTISDGNGNTATATVSVIVTGSGNGNGNVAPIAQDDNATSNGGAVTIDVINNDSDADNDTLTITNITQGNNGTVIINNGQVVFTPNQGFAGTDSFTYTITDGNGNTATATVSVIVTGTGNGGNVAPIAQDDNATSNGGAVTINVMNNDSDADNDTLTITNITQGNNGTVVINNGQIVFTPNQSFTGTDTFTYTISDGNGHTATATVSVIVTGSGNGNGNVAPIAQDDNATSNGGAVTINVINNDSDADNDTLTITNITQGNNGTVIINNGQVIFTPNQGFAGTDSFTYTITDGNGHSATATVNMLVTSSGNNNVAPTADNDSATTTNTAVATGEPVTIDVLANDSDADGDTLTISSVTQPANGTATIVNGQIVYTPIRAGFTGTDTFTYTITDGNGHSTTANVSVVVTASTDGGDTNVAPVAQDDSANSNGTAINIDVLNNDSDADNDPLTVTTITQPQNGSASISNGQVIYTPNQGFAGTDTMSYSISDGNGHTTTATVNVIVTNPGDNSGGNTAPLAQNDSTTTNGTAVTVDVLNNDSDADNDTMFIQSVTQPQNGSATISAGQVLFTPDQGFTGTDSFDYTITDGQGHTASATVNVTVTDSSVDNNSAPTATPDHAVSSGSSITIDVLANDSDIDGDPLTIINTSQPTNGHASIVDGQMLYTPRQGFTGLDGFRYTISDGRNHTSETVVSINVEEAATTSNQAPNVNDDYMGMVQANQALTIQPLNNDSDPDGDELQIISVGNTPNGTASMNSDGTISFMPEHNYCGTIQFDYTVTDGNGHNRTATVHMQTAVL